MNQAAEMIATWAATASSHELRVGPDADDLGGPDTVGAHAQDLAEGQFLPILVQIASHEHGRAPGASATVVMRDAVVAGMTHNQRHSAFASAADTLTQHMDFAAALGRPLARALSRRLRDGLESQDLEVAHIAIEAAECLLTLTLASVTAPWDLLSVIEEAGEAPERLAEPFAVRLPRILGLLDQTHPTVHLHSALLRLLQLDHTHADAAFELAMIDLRTAFNSSTRETMLQGLTTVRTRLAELWEHTEARQDAGIYLAAIDALLAFGGPDTARQVNDAAARLRAQYHHYRAWLQGTPTPAWALPRQQEITSWSETIMIIEEAAAHLDDEVSWLAPPRALHALLKVYTCAAVPASLSVKAAGEALLQPVVEASFLRHSHRQQLLEAALTELPEFRDDPTAIRLAEKLRDLQATAQKIPGGDAGGKALRWPLLAAELPEHQLQDFLASVPDGQESSLDAIELALRSRRNVEAIATDPKRSRLLERLVEELSASPDWIPGIADPFRILLDYTIQFAFTCYDNGRQMGGPYTEYLRARDPSGRKQKIDERLFHQDYLRCLTFTDIASLLKAEVISIGGGRVDLLASFGAVQFPIECKIEEDDASRESLRGYAGQPAQYTVTRSAFAILLVLDLTGHEEGTADVYSSIWIERVRRQHEDHDRFIVTIRIPGGRVDPNRLRTPASQP
ncbi:hypothetical protein [Actinomadura roseirufa]|uniref:hypothetical protein n=1 Tax=Actinomadura roseirufa TaxID=2094049 RepID=UPI0010415DBC|nr:hypothetical protein [Actinomadura roseirufa]